MTENQEVKSKKDLLMERYKAEQPDVEFADDEALFGKISEDYEDYDKMKGEYGTLKEDADVIKDFFAKSPDSAVLFSVIRKDPNHNLVSALIDVYGEEIKDALESEEAKAKLAEASQAYAKRVAENDELEKIAAEAKLPVWLRLKISPSYSLVPEGVQTDEFVENIKPTVKFVKPRKAE